MPPPASSKSKTKDGGKKELVKTGPKEVFSNAAHRARANRPEKLTTSRALLLRNGKYGARGSGEVILMSKLTGRDKLDLLAEDLVEKSQTAVMAPFNMERCQKYAESLFSDFLNTINQLKDPQVFADLIEEEMNSRTPPDPKESKNPSRPWSQRPSLNAACVADRVHNSYLLTSAWKIVCDSLIELQQDGLTNENVATQLKNSERLRTRYLALYDMVNVVVETMQNRFSSLATMSPHYKKFFKTETSELGEPVVTFVPQLCKDLGTSFIDSIIMELCFPRAPYPKAILYSILHDAVEESPKEAANKFPQGFWDAVGDLSDAVVLQQMIEAPLLLPDAASFKDEPRIKPKEFDDWLDAQRYSLMAAEQAPTLQNLVFPLSKARTPQVLENVWKTINLNYKAVTNGKDIDTLWDLQGAMQKPTPQWKPIYVSKELVDDENGKNNGPRRGPLAIKATAEEDEESDDDMPPLQDVSDTDSEFSDDDDLEDSSEEESDESGYDTDQEDELREWRQEAIDVALAEEWFGPGQGNQAPVDPDISESRKGNPFLKLLGSLKGRFINPASKLRSAGVPSQKGTAPIRRPMTTLEEIDGEEGAPKAPKKKKKKKPKKKKKKKSGAATGEGAEGAGEGEDKDDDDDDDDEGDEEEAVATSGPAAAAPATAPEATPAKAAPGTPAKKGPKPPPTSPKKAAGLSATLPAGMSTASLVSQPTVQSGHSYAKEALENQKAKVKTKSAQPSLFSAQGVLAKFGFGKKETEAEKKAKAAKEERHSWFGHLNRKAKKDLHQLLGTAEDEKQGVASMKWDTFVGLMQKMGFEMDASTAGSRVRFDPPDPTLRSVTFHRPHPDPTIGPIKLKEWSKTLKDYYGWTPEDVM